ncbi:MAG: hypothetical protein CVV31_01550 [Methanomicrobiales archaeon HGW-Methanomicrobiales-2]|jgi:hypothetical protein|nr:MAG: hypothetical protein CVV31_01550 [Methanomicrobiales archaeon HGW-Methanomicrobiales-2]
MGDFIFILWIKYIYLDAVSGAMHAPGKWIESGPLFDSLGTLILGIGLLVFASLVIYASGFLT